jgi:hypothetical protein
MSDSNDKRLRYEVLCTAIGLVDQELYWRKESGETVTAPPTETYINKAKELMTFVDDIADPTVKTVTQLLTEHMGK